MPRPVTLLYILVKSLYRILFKFVKMKLYLKFVMYGVIIIMLYVVTFIKNLIQLTF